MAWGSRQVIPPMEEKEMTKIFLKTLGVFYYERMVASASSDFTEMVGMGIWLEEAVREGRLTKSESSRNMKKPSYGFAKKKEEDIILLCKKGGLILLEEIISIISKSPQLLQLLG